MGFVSAFASQTNPSVLALNVLTVLFSTYGSLQASSQITISGLSGSSPNSSNVININEQSGAFG
eukprot:218742-Hanusia_phi.AAC.1